MSKPPRYTTFASGELETRLKEMAPNASFISVPRCEGAGRMGSGTLFKEHNFTVTLPDGTQSPCRYDRLGSQYHRFSYAYQDGTALPRQNLFERLANDVKTIEDKGQELASACFRDAIEYGNAGSILPALLNPLMAAASGVLRSLSHERRKRRRRLGGYYALCHRTQNGLLPFGVAYATLEKANAALNENAQPNAVVACCNRLDRCWEIPRLNPQRKEKPEDGSV